MKKSQGFYVVLFFVFLSCLPASLSAQTSSTDPVMASTHFDTSGFPLWARDLRRAEIIAFGSFPFAYFFANFAYDTYRWANNGWDTRYAPWPIASAGSIEQTQDEKIMTLGIAAGGAILIALIDYGIMRYKRHRLEKEAAKLPEGTPIIIKRPLYAGEVDEAPANGGASETE